MALIGNAVVIKYLAWNNGLNAGQAADAANHTLRLVVDGVEITPSGTPVQVNAVTLPGVYALTVTAAENIGSIMTLGGTSSTANVTIAPVRWANSEGMGGLCIGVNPGVSVGGGSDAGPGCR